MTSCERLKKALHEPPATGPAAMAYPPSTHVDAAIVKHSGGLAVVGCCGTCYVIEGLKFCPFCGEAVT